MYGSDLRFADHLLANSEWAYDKVRRSGTEISLGRYRGTYQRGGSLFFKAARPRRGSAPVGPGFSHTKNV